MSPTSRKKKPMTSLPPPSLLIAVLAALLSSVSGHGRLVEPPSRSSMWRFGFKTKPNYNDNELFCGGFTVQWQRNGGKCGVCGDAWHLDTPRPNEAGGTYGKGIIVRRYKPGQVIKSTVDITANHRGFFEFKLCPHNNPRTVVTQDCLDHHPIPMADGSGTKYFPHPGTGPFNVQLRLPQQVTCTQCVFQWSYTAGNNWGRCDNGTSKVGCGPQETFRGCADVAIQDSESNDIPTYAEHPPLHYGPSISAIPTRKSPPRARPRPTPPTRYRPTTSTRRPYYRRPTAVSSTKRPIWKQQPQSTPAYNYPRPVPTRRQRPLSTPAYNYPSRKQQPKPSPTLAYNYPRRQYTTRRPLRPSPYRTKRPVTKKPSPTHKAKVGGKKPTEAMQGSCRGVGAWKTIAGIASWCDSNCARGFCPASHCDCS